MAGDTLKASYQEGFYGLRLYRSRTGEYLIGVCLRRMDLCWGVETFLRQPIASEIVELRMAEHDALLRACSP